MTRDSLTGVWFFLGLFYGFFIYYIEVFLIATATAIWYYSMEDNFIVTGFKWIFNSHIGSFTFASLIVAVVAFLRSAS